MKKVFCSSRHNFIVHLETVCEECLPGRYNPDRGCRDKCRSDDDCENGICQDTDDGNRCKSTTCSQNSDCNEGKCMILPGQELKSCLCPMTHAGSFCESLRTCDYADIPNQRPCLNDGNCIEGASSERPDLSYTCDCSETYFSGFHCEDVHPCHPLKVGS